MAEQFLRIGGTDGEFARALRTDEKGRIITKLLTNIELSFSQNEQVTANNSRTVVNTTDIKGFEKLYIMVRADSNHDFDVNCYFLKDFGGNTFGQVMTDELSVMRVEDNDKGVSPHFPVQGALIQIRINNRDNQAHNYDVVLMGV